MKLKALVLGVGLALGCGVAAAQGLNYSYVQGGLERSSGWGSADGLFVEGSYRVTDDIFVAGSYSSVDSSWYEMTMLTVRGGYIFPISDTMDAYAEGGIANTEVKSRYYGSWLGSGSWGSHSDTGLLLGGGVRMMVMPELEVYGGARMITGDHDDIFINGGVAYEFMPNLSVVGNLTRILDASQSMFRVGVRYGF